MTERSDDARLTDLEMRLTFIDDTVNALSSADTAQSRRLLALEQAIADMRNELRAMHSAPEHDGHSEPPPPHY